jgi:hypothetical protein
MPGSGRKMESSVTMGVSFQAIHLNATVSSAWYHHATSIAHLLALDKKLHSIETAS